MSRTLPDITSRRHPLVHAARDARNGGADQPLLLDGWHLLVEAVGAGIAVDAVVVDRAPADAAAARALETLERAGAQVVRASADVLQAMSPVRTPSGVVALARRPETSLTRVFAATPAFVLVAVDVQDPGNMGALVRTAEAAGATGVVAAGASADPLGWKALRASMGSAFRMPLARAGDVADVVDIARGSGVTVIALVPRDGVRPERIDAASPLVLLMGGEGPGLPPDVIAGADLAVTLPMRPPVESLNVAVAGALALYAVAARRPGR
ncbi:MAG: RNA methyltransferase [Vicinamibacterales bacterium]